MLGANDRSSFSATTRTQSRWRLSMKVRLTLAEADRQRHIDIAQKEAGLATDLLLDLDLDLHSEPP